MLDFLQEKLKGCNLSEAEIMELGNQLSLVIILKLINASNSFLTDKDRQDIKVFTVTSNFQGIIDILKNKYNESDWKKLLANQINPTLDKYAAEVINAK